MTTKPDPLAAALDALSASSDNAVERALRDGKLTEDNITSLIDARKRRVGYKRLAMVLTEYTGTTIGKSSVETFLTNRGVD